MTASLVLASQSPRRKELLHQLDVPFTVQAADIDETPHPGEHPRDYVLRLAREKAAAVAKSRPDAVVLAADTTVTFDGQILGKPQSEAEGVQMLELLSGREHEVFTGVAVAGPKSVSAVVRTAVRFRPLSRGEIDWYVKSGEGRDKAGGYGIQGRAGFFISGIDGSHSNVIGLPISELVGLLDEAGVRLPWKVGA